MRPAAGIRICGMGALGAAKDLHTSESRGTRLASAAETQTRTGFKTRSGAAGRRRRAATRRGRAGNHPGRYAPECRENERANSRADRRWPLSIARRRDREEAEPCGGRARGTSRPHGRRGARRRFRGKAENLESPSAGGRIARSRDEAAAKTDVRLRKDTYTPQGRRAARMCAGDRANTQSSDLPPQTAVSPLSATTAVREWFCGVLDNTRKKFVKTAIPNGVPGAGRKRRGTEHLRRAGRCSGLA